MKTTCLAILIFVALFCFNQVSVAQDSSRIIRTDQDTAALKEDSLSGEKKIGAKYRSYFEVNANYQSNNVYLGRKDSTALPYFTPMLSYYHKSGIYVSLSTAFLANAETSRIDVVTLESGYSFSAGNYSGDFTASKYFYNSQSTNVSAEIKAVLTYQNSYNFGFIRPTFTGSWSLGNTPDFDGSLGLEHSFECVGDKLEFTPSFVANFHRRRHRQENG